VRGSACPVFTNFSCLRFILLARVVVAREKGGNESRCLTISPRFPDIVFVIVYFLVSCDLHLYFSSKLRTNWGIYINS